MMTMTRAFFINTNNKSDSLFCLMHFCKTTKKRDITFSNHAYTNIMPLSHSVDG